jgi:hypothetical protein
LGGPKMKELKNNNGSIFIATNRPDDLKLISLKQKHPDTIFTLRDIFWNIDKYSPIEIISIEILILTHSKIFLGNIFFRKSLYSLRIKCSSLGAIQNSPQN